HAPGMPESVDRGRPARSSGAEKSGRDARGPQSDSTFTKASVIEEVLNRLGIRGAELIGFGDGVVETQAIKAAGGVAVGVASAEPGQSGVNAEKRDRLAAAGADVIIPEYSEQEALVAWLWGEV